MGRKAGKSKKRNKKYTGVDAKRPNNVVRVRRVEAVTRSNFHQWLYDHRTPVKYGVILAVIVALVVAGIRAIF